MFTNAKKVTDHNEDCQTQTNYRLTADRMTTTNAGDEFPLTSLLPSTSYLLAYSIPLLLLSVVLTFAGTFLILDRTRSFAPNYDALPGAFKRARKVSFTLEGGVGGLAVGYAFGGMFPTSTLPFTITHIQFICPHFFLSWSLQYPLLSLSVVKLSLLYGCYRPSSQRY